MKKTLAFILALTLMLSLAFVPASAAEEFEGDLSFIKAFGFTPADKEIYADTAITRIELAEIFYNIIFPDNNKSNEYYGEKDFPDVPIEKKHIAATVYGMGVMRGYSDDVFAPNDHVTFTQAVKAMVSFLGYDLQAQNLGGYPSGYLAQATRLQIMPGVNVPGDAVANYGGIASMLKKAIGADIAIWNHTEEDGTATLEVLEDVNYLEYYRNVKILRGTVTGNYLTDVYGGEAISFFGVCINGQRMEIAKGAKGIQDMLGYDVHVYYTSDGTNLTAVYYEEGLNNVLEIDSGDIASVSTGKINYYLPGEDSVYQATFSSKTPLIYNGTYEASYTVNDINPFKNGNYDGSVKLIDTNNDTIYDSIVVTAFQTIVVSDYRNGKIYGMYDVASNPGNKVIDLSHYKERNINVRDISGDLVVPEMIKKGHVINVCRDKNGVVKEIIASDDSMTGVIEEISYSGGKITAVKVSGVTFDAANGIVVVDSAGKLAPGCTADIFFNCETEIAVLDLESNYASGYLTGYLVDAAEDGTLEKKVDCVVFGSDGIMNTYKLADRLVLGGVPTNAADVLQSFGKTGKRVRRQVVLYKTDPDGEIITAMQIAPEIASDNQAFDGFYQYPGTSFSYDGGQKCFSGLYLATDNTLVFGVPEEKNRDDYDRYTLSELPAGGSKAATLDMQLYGTKDTAIVVDIAVRFGGSSGSGDTSRKPFFIVTKVSTAINDDGEEGIKISGTFFEGMGTNVYEGGFFVKPELLINGHDLGNSNDANNGKRPFIDQTETLPEVGDIFRIPPFSATGSIDTMDITQFYQLYDYGDNTFIDNTGVHYDEGSESRVHLFGTVSVKEGDSSIKLTLPDGSKRSIELSSGYQFIEVTKNKQTGELSIKKSNVGAVLAENTHPGEASRIVLHYRTSGIGCFIFNDR